MPRVSSLPWREHNMRYTSNRMAHQKLAGSAYLNDRKALPGHSEVKS